MSLTLHSHPLSSYCWKVLIALHENGTPFENRLVDLGDPQARAAFAALWATRKIPLLQDGANVVPETSIMIEHVDRRYPGKIPLLPDNPDTQLDARLWDRLFDLYVMDPMQRFIAQQLRPEAERDTRTMAASLTGLARAYQMIETRLDGRPWIAGTQFSMADCAAAPSLFYGSIIAPFPQECPRLASYFERLMARPSVRQVIADARPYFQYFPLHHAIPPRFLAGDADAA